MGNLGSPTVESFDHVRDEGVVLMILVDVDQDALEVFPRAR